MKDIKSALRNSAFANPAKKKTQSKKVKDVTTSHTDVGKQRHDVSIDTDKLQTIIKELSSIGVSTYGTPVRLSKQEKQDIDNFIYDTLRKNNITGRNISIGKLMRYAFRYLYKVHQKEFIDCLKKSLVKKEKLTI